MIEFPAPPSTTAGPPPPVYCPTCGRKVKAKPGAKTPRHNDLSTGQVCRPVGMPATTDPDPDTRSAGHPSGQTPENKGGGQPPTAGRSDAARRAEPKRAGEDDEEDAEATYTGGLRLVVDDGDQPRARVKSYDPAVKAAAIARMNTHGLAAVHDLTDIPKGTLSRWAREANLDLGAVAKRQTADATLAAKARLAQARVTTIAMLEQQLADAGHYLSRVAEANALAAETLAMAPPEAFERKIGLMGPYVVVTDEAAAQAADRAMALAGLPLSAKEAVGIVTRAIHDLQLLNGEATERGELKVVFGAMPRPNPREVEVVQVEANPPSL